MKPINWIEKALGRQMEIMPIYIGSRGGRKIYTITWCDGTEQDYYIDFDRHEIGEV